MIRIFNKTRPLFWFGLCVALVVLFCLIDAANNGAFGCEVGDTDAGQDAGQGQSQSNDSDVGNATQSSTSGDYTQHEGNGGESWTLIDCSNPFWWDLVPCQVHK